MLMLTLTLINPFHLKLSLTNLHLSSSQTMPDQPTSSTPPIINVSLPLTLLLDSIVLKEVSENIFE